MYIKMIGLYGMENQKAYFRKVGDGCFEFCSNKKYASVLSKEEAKQVLEHKDWYLKQYNAEFVYSIRG